MFLQHIEIANLKPGPVTIKPRERYTKYFRDLCQQHYLTPDKNSWNIGSQKSYIELLEPLLFQLAKQSLLSDIDCLCICSWAPEFDPDYSSYGQYLIKHWAPQAKLINVCDQGMLNFFTALNLAHAYLNSGYSKKFLILIAEQTTIPGYIGMTCKQPFSTGSSGLILSKVIQKNAWHIIKHSISSTENIENAILYKEPGLLPFCHQLTNTIKNEKEKKLTFAVQDVETYLYGHLSLIKQCGDKDESF